MSRPGLSRAIEDGKQLVVHWDNCRGRAVYNIYPNLPTTWARVQWKLRDRYPEVDALHLETVADAHAEPRG